ncbi:UbiA family prenyltransferase [Chloroflexota bacterium]
MFRNLIVSTRPKQWYKNSLIFVGIVYSANILNVSMWATIVLAFVYFCMLSAGEYLINDILDKERDRRHPVKRKRPIASEQLKVSHALLFALLLIVLALLGSYLTINIVFLVCAASYALLFLLYSLVLQYLIITDVLVISIGFVIRATAGCLAINLFPSSWLILCVFLLALFLTLEKRRHDLVILSDEAETHRTSLSGFSTKMLEQLIGITIAALITSYMLYTYFSEFDGMLLTVPFVIYGLFRYLYLVHEKGVGPEPELVFKDKAMLINLGIWVLVVASIILYGTRV